MLTPQEVSSKTFTKAVMGGYTMSAVDDFLDVLTEDYTALYKENAALKSKIKMLAEKMEESQQSEASFRSLLLSAQKMAQEIIADAEAQREKIVGEAKAQQQALVGDAESVARRRIEELRAEIAEAEEAAAQRKKEIAEEVAGEEYRLQLAQQSTREFMDLARAACRQQLDVLDQIEDAVPPAPAAEESVFTLPPEVEESVFAPASAEEVWPPLPVDEDAEDDDEEEEEGFLTSVLPTLTSLKDMLRRPRREEVDDEDDDDEDADDGEEEAEEDDPFAAEPAEPAAPQRPVEEDIMEAMARLSVGGGQETLFTSEPEEETRVINLDDLQFGRNYTRED